MNPQAQIIEDILTSGPLLEIGLYNINTGYVEVESERLWIIDGAIQLSFSKGHLRIGWSGAHALFQSSTVHISQDSGEFEFLKLTTGNVPLLNNLLGKKVTAFDWDWYSYETWDDQSDDFITNQSLSRLQLQLGDDQLLIAAVDYQMNKEDEPVNFILYPQQELLVSLNNPVPIQRGS